MREFLPADALFYMDMLNDEDFKRHIADRGIHNVDLALEHLEARVFSSYDAHGFGMWCVTRLQDNVPVGMAGLVKRDFLDDVDLGYALLPAGRGMGYATEASEGVMHYARNRLQLKRLAAIVSTGNTASNQVLARLGFELQGVIEFPGTGELCNHYRRDLGS